MRWQAGQGQAQEKEKEKEAAKEPEALKPDELDAEIAEMAIEEPREDAGSDQPAAGQDQELQEADQGGWPSTGRSSQTSPELCQEQGQVLRFLPCTHVNLEDHGEQTGL